MDIQMCMWKRLKKMWRGFVGVKMERGKVGKGTRVCLLNYIHTDTLDTAQVKHWCCCLIASPAGYFNWHASFSSSFPFSFSFSFSIFFTFLVRLYTYPRASTDFRIAFFAYIIWSKLQFWPLPWALVCCIVQRK